MTMEQLEQLMVKHGLVIRAIPHTHTGCYEVRHRREFPNAEVFYDETRKREMIRVEHRNSQGGKFIITESHTQGTVINQWCKAGRKKVKFYDSIEQAVTDYLRSL